MKKREALIPVTVPVPASHGNHRLWPLPDLRRVSGWGGVLAVRPKPTSLPQAVRSLRNYYIHYPKAMEVSIRVLCFLQLRPPFSLHIQSCPSLPSPAPPRLPIRRERPTPWLDLPDPRATHAPGGTAMQVARL